MDEYIRKSKLKESIAPILSDSWCPAFVAATIEQYIDSEPAEVVEPVIRAKWKYYKKRNKAVCTNCSFERDLDDNFGLAISCPNCGAKMD